MNINIEYLFPFQILILIPRSTTLHSKSKVSVKVSIHSIMVYTWHRQCVGYEVIFADDIPEPMCQPVQARAPEMMLGHPWSTLIDIWSLGCIVSRYSFCTGWHVDWLTFCLEDVRLSHGCPVIRLLSAGFCYLWPPSAVHRRVSRSLPTDLPWGLSWL
jgi:hypothetical protein